MIHLVKQKKGFAVINVAKNGEPLKTSETLQSKQKCWQNIKAEMRDCYSQWRSIFVQDDTLPEPKMFVFFKDEKTRKWHKVASTFKPSEKYIPGRNPSTKKKKK